MNDTTGTPSVPATTVPTSDSVPVEPALVDGVDVDAVVRAVRACAGVADLHSGPFGEFASYLPGRRVGGVQVDDRSVTVHIRARWGYTSRDLLSQIDAVTVPLRHRRRLALVVADIDDDITSTHTVAGTAVSPPRAIEPPDAGTSATDNPSSSETSTT